MYLSGQFIFFSIKIEDRNVFQEKKLISRQNLNDSSLRVMRSVGLRRQRIIITNMLIAVLRHVRQFCSNILAALLIYGGRWRFHLITEYRYVSGILSNLKYINVYNHMA